VDIQIKSNLFEAQNMKEKKTDEKQVVNQMGTTIKN